jgi:ATP:cob(I)alamin adenosyltransferase
VVKIYTKTGDSGETSLFDNTRVSKADARVDAYGEVDEVNACLGAARAAGVDAETSVLIEALQKDLFALGARLADPSARIADRVTKAAIGDADVQRLEQAIDRLEATLPPLRRFILPGGSAAGALLHVGPHRLPPRRAPGDWARGRRGRPDPDRLPESPVRSVVRDGACRQPSRRSSGNGVAMKRQSGDMGVWLWALGFGTWDL